MKIRPGKVEDAQALAAFASSAFEDAFGATIGQEDMTAFLSTTFGPERQARELADPAWTTLLAEDGGRLVAYAQLRAGIPPPCVSGDAPLELVRFYVDRSRHGKGLAALLMDEVLAAAAARDCGTLWLGVWEQNQRAISFYRRMGFRTVGEKSFQIGGELQADLVMQR